jgi:hypothetical protein
MAAATMAGRDDSGTNFGNGRRRREIRPYRPSLRTIEPSTEPLNDFSGVLRKSSKHLLHLAAPARRGFEVSYCVFGGACMRWFYAFLLVLAAWGSFVEVNHKNAPDWRTWDEPH